MDYKILLNDLENVLLKIQPLEHSCLTYSGHKHLSMARVYTTAAALELSKLMFAECSQKVQIDNYRSSSH